jgi:possible eps3O protein
MQAKLKSELAQLGYRKVCISWPYKLCDYKPTYGYLFEEDLRGYDYWGYIDCDLVFGNIRKFLQKIDFGQYDRVFRYGHFSMCRNREDINLLFTKATGKEINFRDIADSAFIHNFDESGMNHIFIDNGYRFLNCSYDATFQIYDYAYRWHNGGHPERGELFVKEADGSTTVYTEKEDGSIECTEVCYIHYMTKKQVCIEKDCPRPYAITHNGTICLEKTSMDVISQAIKRYTLCTVEQQKTLITSEIKRFRKDSLKKTLREFRYKGMYTVIELCARFTAWYRHRKSYIDKHCQ